MSSPATALHGLLAAALAVSLASAVALAGHIS
jgi:hypothetical protein